MPSHSSSLMQRHHGGMEGPRPGTLKVAKAADHQQLGLIKKRRRPEQQQVRPPVIIFVESPKVVHAHPGEFKSVVQRLTGAPPVPSSSSSMATVLIPPPASAHLPPPLALQFPFQLLCGQQLPAASSLPPADHAAGSVMRSLSFFSNDRRLIQLYDEESMVAAAAGAAAVQEPNNHQLLVSSSLGACYHHHITG